MKEYAATNLRVRFSAFGATVAAAQLFPNLLWALFPPSPNRLAGNVSSSPFIEYGEHILGVLVVVLLVLVVNNKADHAAFFGFWGWMAYGLIGAYWVFWALYFCGLQQNAVLYALVVLPPGGFICAGFFKKVLLIPAVGFVFLIFHLLVALENFPLF